MRKLVLIFIAVVAGLFVGAGIAAAQASCTKVKCVLQTCTVYPYTENSYKTQTDSAWDSVIHAGRCPVDCFQWPCTSSSVSAKPCKKSPDDLGDLSHIVENFGVVTIERVRRGDVEKYIRVFAKQKNYNSLAEFVAGINPQMMAWRNPVYSLGIAEEKRLDAYFETHQPTTMEELHAGLVLYTGSKIALGR